MEFLFSTVLLGVVPSRRQDQTPAGRGRRLDRCSDLDSMEYRQTFM